MTELRVISRHAGTVLAGQLATMAYGVTDTIVAGRYSEGSLASLSVGSAIYMSVYVALMGVLQALMPVWAELHGAGHPRKLGHSFHQALYVWASLSTLGVLVLLHPAPVLSWAHVPAGLQGEVGTYLAVLATALPVALLFRLYSTLNQSVGLPHLVTLLQLGSLALKIPLSVALTFGWVGLSPLGAPGCAWATLLVQCVMLGLALILLRLQDVYRPYDLWKWPARPDRAALARLLRLGIPSGLTILVEVTSFTLMALFIARLGTAASAGHQIAANMAAVLYMVPLAIGIASSARTSYWLGAGQPHRARHAVAVGFGLVATSAVVLASALALTRNQIAALYASSPDVIAQASILLGWVAVYHLFDGLQALGVFILRCWNVTISPFIVYGVLLWGMGLYGGYRLAYEGLGPWPALHSPSAFWIAGAWALACAASAFWLMLWRALRRGTPA